MDRKVGSFAKGRQIISHDILPSTSKKLFLFYRGSFRLTQLKRLCRLSSRGKFVEIDPNPPKYPFCLLSDTRIIESCK